MREFGGWNPETVTEDTDLTLRLVLAGQRVRFDVTAIDTEESVSTFRRFWRQRYRWARGHQQAWREYRGAVWRAPNLTFSQKIETTMFLLVYHVPVACALGGLLIIARAAGLLTWGNGMDLTPIATLLFLGPLLELASGLVVSSRAASLRVRDPAVPPVVRAVHDRVHEGLGRRRARPSVHVEQDPAHGSRPDPHRRDGGRGVSVTA